MTETDPTAEFDRDVVEGLLSGVPDRPLVSMYDVGLLYAAASKFDLYQKDNFPTDVPAKHVFLMTPYAKRSWLGDEYSVTELNIDISGDTPELGDKPVTFSTYTEDSMFKLGIYKNPSGGSSTNFSITNQTSNSGESPESLANTERHIAKRFTNWPYSPGAEQLIENNHDDAWIFEELRQFGETEENIEELKDAIIRLAPYENETHSFITVRVKTESDGEYRYPGEIAGFNKAAVINKKHKLGEKGTQLTGVNTVGDGVGLVSNEAGDVYGATGGLLGQYSKKKVDKFPHLNHKKSWYAHPVSPETALLLTDSTDSIERFSVYVNGFDVYYLPYPSDTVITPEVFARFYQDVYRPLGTAAAKAQSDSDVRYAQRLISILSTTDAVELETQSDSNVGADPWESGAFESAESSDTLTLKLLNLVHTGGGSDPDRLYQADNDAQLELVSELNTAYNTVRSGLQSRTVFGETNFGTYPFPNTDFNSIAVAVLERRLFEDLTANVPRVVTSGTADDRGETTSAPTLEWYRQLMMSKELSVDQLLREYTNKLRKEARKEAGDEQTAGVQKFVLAQYEQLMTLEVCDLLSESLLAGDSTDREQQLQSMNEDNTSNDNDEALEQFISDHEILRENQEARAVFLLGALAGRISAFQHNKGVSQKLTDAYSVENMNVASIERIADEVLAKNQQYISAYSSLGPKYNKRYVSRLQLLLDNNPDEFDIPDVRARWIYALGISYGTGDSSRTREAGAQTAN